jgi:hypothetical protein
MQLLIVYHQHLCHGLTSHAESWPMTELESLGHTPPLIHLTELNIFCRSSTTLNSTFSAAHPTH